MKWGIRPSRVAQSLPMFKICIDEFREVRVKPYPYPVLVVLSLIRADQSTLLYPVELPLIRAVPDDAQS